MIAAICSWHEHHRHAAREIQQRLQRREKLVVAAPAMVEGYAVLTRLPPPHRLSPEDSLTLLEANFIKGAVMIALQVGSYRDLLRQAPKNGVAGGQTYDAVIAMCAVKARASALLTFNPSDFLFAAQQIDIIVPGTV
jgi:predicted nucleic acid-binding protein